MKPDVWGVRGISQLLLSWGKETNIGESIMVMGGEKEMGVGSKQTEEKQRRQSAGVLHLGFYVPAVVKRETPA